MGRAACPGAPPGLDGDAQTTALELGQRAGEGGHPIGGQLDPQDAGETPCQVGHAAFQPVAFVIGDGLGHRLDQPGAVGAEQREHQIGRGGIGGHGVAIISAA